MPAQPDDIIQLRDEKNSDMETRYNILIDKLCSANQNLEKVKEEAKIKEQDLLAQIENLKVINEALASQNRSQIQNEDLTRGGTKTTKRQKPNWDSFEP